VEEAAFGDIPQPGERRAGDDGDGEPAEPATDLGTPDDDRRRTDGQA
jgi:hypothetical protein